MWVETPQPRTQTAIFPRGASRQVAPPGLSQKTKAAPSLLLWLLSCGASLRGCVLLPYSSTPRGFGRVMAPRPKTS
jgi:hypothetical protein